MSIYALYFSPTGGVHKVLEIITETMDSVIKINISDAFTMYSSFHFCKEDTCFIGIPSYGGRVPNILLERLKVMQVDGALAIPVVAYGNRAYDDTLLEMKNELTTYGFRVVAAIAAVTEHSILRQFGTGRPDYQDQKELQEYTQKIKAKLTKPNESKSCQVPGGFPYREYNGVPFKPKTNTKCTQCGLCATKCPVNAIPTQHPSLTHKKTCISCMRCISICPQKARYLPSMLLFTAAKAMKKTCTSRKKNQLFL